MKRVLFTLSAVTVMSACGLVIDPDKLVEGNAADPGAPGGGDGGTEASGSIDSGGAGSDAKADGAPAQVPQCVPPKPAGAEGPYAVVAATAPATAACPAGYLATPVGHAKGDLTADAMACANTGSCTCGAAGESPSCGYRLRYFIDFQCTKERGIPTTVSSTCREIANENYLKLEVVVGGVTCSQTGPATTAPSSKPPPTYQTDRVICAPDPAAKTGACSDGKVGIPPATNASACVTVPTSTPCPAPYTNTLDGSSGAVNDGRTCACSCTTSSTTCTGGGATLYEDFNCAAGSAALAVDTCKISGTADSVNGTPPVPGGAACAPKATPSGTLTAQNDVRLCCLP